MTGSVPNSKNAEEGTAGIPSRPLQSSLKQPRDGSEPKKGVSFSPDVPVDTPNRPPIQDPKCNRKHYTFWRKVVVGKCEKSIMNGRTTLILALKRGPICTKMVRQKENNYFFKRCCVLIVVVLIIVIGVLILASTVQDNKSHEQVIS